MRWIVVVATLVAASCSGGTEPESGRPTVPPPTVAPATTDTRAVDAESAPAVESRQVEEVPRSVSMTVRTPTIDAAVDGLLTVATDPFGDFVSCSGLRSWVGTYSVMVSSSSGAVRMLSIVSDDPVDGPGIYDAGIRLELATGAAVDAIGTVTLAAGLAAGTYLAFDADGSRLEGEFECVGAGSPEPLTVGDDDGRLDSVEVFALLRSGDAERLVGLATKPGAGASVECPGAEGASGPSVVRVDGDESIGAITTFELTGGDAPTMRMRIGATIYEFARVTPGETDTQISGSFSASTGSVTVDGAFRCS